jgi:predicted nucleotidyltransferase
MVSNMNMSKLFSTKEREAVLAEILLKKGKISGAEVARNLGISKGFVSRYLAILKKEKIITRSNGDYVAEANLGVRLLRIILNLKPMAHFNVRKYPFVTGVGIYGSCIKGESNEDSDIDLWIKISQRNEMALAELSAALRKRWGNVSPLYLTVEKLKILEKEDLPFFHSLVFGSIRIYGEDLV